MAAGGAAAATGSGSAAREGDGTSSLCLFIPLSGVGLGGVMRFLGLAIPFGVSVLEATPFGLSIATGDEAAGVTDVVRGGIDPFDSCLIILGGLGGPRKTGAGAGAMLEGDCTAEVGARVSTGD